MADILSQAELDALLDEVKADEPELGGVEIPPEPIVERRPDAPVSGMSPDEAHRNIEVILDIPVQVSVELGRARLTIGELLDLSQGAVVELTRLASDMIDLSVNRHVIAQGEAVVVHENFGFRVVDIDSVRDRIRKL